MSVTHQPRPLRERRMSTRVPICLPLTVFGPGQGQRGTCMSISTGGATLLVARAHERGELLYLEIQLPTGPILATAEVVSTRPDQPNEVGVRFEQLDPEALFALHSLIAQKR